MSPANLLALQVFDNPHCPVRQYPQDMTAPLVERPCLMPALDTLMGGKGLLSAAFCLIIEGDLDPISIHGPPFVPGLVEPVYRPPCLKF
jgi:hypothetical protein